jgi:hypothetical protein
MEPKSPRPFAIEFLESRTLLSATIAGTPTVVNTGSIVGPQTDESITINPTNPLQVFVTANTPGGAFASSSLDGGKTWTPRIILNGTDGLPAAGGNPVVAFDRFGNLFLAYSRADGSTTEVLNSFDGGQTFHVLANLPGLQSRPQIATGNGSVWVALQQTPLAGSPASVAQAGASLYGAKVTGLGRIGKFAVAETISTVHSVVEGLAVGPAGQVTVAYQFQTDVGPTIIYTATDPDGLGPKKLGPVNTQTSTQVGTTDPVPPQALAGVDAEAGVAYDSSSDPFTGRVYLVYTDAVSPASPNTNIFLRFSDDNGTTWSDPVQVNDDTTQNSHFLPRVAVDPITGTVGVTWYDARNDNGIPGQGGTDNTANDDVQVYGAVGTATASGVTFSPNFVIQPAPSNAADIANSALSASSPSLNELGAHIGLAFYNGVMIPAWADNSDSTGNNADGPLVNPDVYTAVVNVTTTPTPTGTLIGTFGDGSGSLVFTASNGTRATFHLHGGNAYLFSDASGNLVLRVSGSTTHSALSITTARGTRRITLDGVEINGSIGSFNASTADVAGNFIVQGSAGHIAIGSLSGGALSATGTVGTVTTGSLTNAFVLSGANPGNDLAFAGAGDTDDSFQAGSIQSIVVTGAIQNSVIGAGVNPVDGIFGNGNDTIIGGAASRIGSIRAGSADSTSRFEAGAFGPVRIGGVLVATSDPRFLLG